MEESEIAATVLCERGAANSQTRVEAAPKKTTSLYRTTGPTLYWSYRAPASPGPLREPGPGRSSTSRPCSASAARRDGSAISSSSSFDRHLVSWYEMFGWSNVSGAPRPRMGSY